MSERLFKFLLSELKLIRIRCKYESCNAVVELPISDLETMPEIANCPVCKRAILPYPELPKDLVRFSDFARAVRVLGNPKNPADIEFVLPDPGE